MRNKLLSILPLLALLLLAPGVTFADDDYNHGGHEPVIIIVDGFTPELLGAKPPADCTPANPCNASDTEAAQTRIQLMLFLKLTGRL